MFWPPSWRTNNLVSITDAFNVASGNDARFTPYVQAACFLSPWLARTDQDTKWVAGDPMARILLVSDSGTPLYTVNADTIGSTIMLTDGPLGQQQWEVVSKFEWYDESSSSMVGLMCWCRLCSGITVDPGEGGGEGGDLGDGAERILFSEGSGIVSDEDSFLELGFTDLPEGLFLLDVVLNGTGINFLGATGDFSPDLITGSSGAGFSVFHFRFACPGLAGLQNISLEFDSADTVGSFHAVVIGGIITPDPVSATVTDFGAATLPSAGPLTFAGESGCYVHAMTFWDYQATAGPDYVHPANAEIEFTGTTVNGRFGWSFHGGSADLSGEMGGTPPDANWFMLLVAYK